MKRFTDRIIRCGWLVVFLLLVSLAPVTFTACDNPAPELNISMETDLSGVLAALNNANTSLGDKLSSIEKAMSDGLADSQEALEMVRKAVASMEGTMAEKLAAIEEEERPGLFARIKAQYIEAREGRNRKLLSEQAEAKADAAPASSYEEPAK